MITAETAGASALEEKGHRPVVHQRHLHVGTEDAGGHRIVTRSEQLEKAGLEAQKSKLEAQKAELEAAQEGFRGQLPD